jgi:hypothetical protein
LTPVNEPLTASKVPLTPVNEPLTASKVPLTPVVASEFRCPS